MSADYRRKQYIVDRSLQFKFSKFVVLLSFSTAIITGLVIFYTTFFLLGEKLAEIYPQGRLIAIFRSVYGSFFICMLLILPVVFYCSIVFSHRIAGPLPKIYRALESIGNGNFDIKLVLRKHDHLRSLADVINTMAANLRERESQSKKETP